MTIKGDERLWLDRPDRQGAPVGYRGRENGHCRDNIADGTEGPRVRGALLKSESVAHLSERHAGRERERAGGRAGREGQREGGAGGDESKWGGGREKRGRKGGREGGEGRSGRKEKFGRKGR